MRIAIDVESAYGNRTGNGVYVEQMVANLARVAERGEYTLFRSKGHESSQVLDVGGNSRFRQVSLPVSRRILQTMWMAAGWPPVSRYIGEHDVYHSMTSSPLPIRSGRYVVTVHDLSWMARPDLYNRRHRHVWSVTQWRMLRRVDHLVAVSESTKRDIVRYLKVPEERITVILEGARPCFRPVEHAEVDRVLDKYGVDAPYFIVLGDINLRKNHPRLVRSFARLLAETGMQAYLLFCGPWGYRSDLTYHEVQRLRLGKWVKFMGYLPDGDIVPLVNGARGLMFTSLHEGFGLPILESMACGTPVITSNVTSMPEVAGDAALLVDPMSEMEICKAMKRLLTEEKTRAEYSAKGLSRAKEFSWEKSACQLEALYWKLA